MKPIKQVGKYTLEFYDEDDDMLHREITDLNFYDSIQYCKQMLMLEHSYKSFTIDMARFNSKYNVWSIKK